MNMDGLLAALTQGTPGQIGNPLMDMGLGLLSVAGPSSQPQSIGQGLLMGQQMGANRQKMALDNELVRARLDELAMQREALAAQQAQEAALREALPGLLSTMDLTDDQKAALSLMPPEEAIGLLGKSLFERERAETSLIRNVRALEDPTLTADQKAIIYNELVRDPNASDELMRTLDLQMRSLQLQIMQRDIAQEDANADRAQGQLIVNIRRDLKSLQELADLNDALDGTALETGLPLSELRRIAASGAGALSEVLGIDDRDAKKIVADFDRFTKLSTDFALQSTARLFDRGTISNQQLQTVMAASVSPFVAPGANRLIISDSMNLLLDAAEAEGIDIVGAADLRALATRLRAGDVPTESGSGRFVYDPATGGLVPQ